MKNKLLAIAMLGLTFAGAAAQADAPARATLRGTIASVDASALEVTTRNGTKIAVGLTAATGVADVTYAKITDIKPGSFIGTAAVPQPDGSLKALEVHVFAPDLRGTGEGSRAWQGDGRKGSMTNGTVGDLLVTNGRTMTVHYKGGEKKILVPPDVPIVYIEAGHAADLTIGSHVIVIGQKGADGAVTALRVLVGRDGVVPPM